PRSARARPCSERSVAGRDSWLAAATAVGRSRVSGSESESPSAAAATAPRDAVTGGPRRSPLLPHDPRCGCPLREQREPRTTGGRGSDPKPCADDTKAGSCAKPCASPLL